jgi:hypothetical protein
MGPVMPHRINRTLSFYSVEYPAIGLTVNIDNCEMKFIEEGCASNRVEALYMAENKFLGVYPKLARIATHGTQ